MIKIMKKEIKIGTLLTTKYKKNLETLQECKRHNNMDVHEKIEKKKKDKKQQKKDTKHSTYHKPLSGENDCPRNGLSRSCTYKVIPF